MSDSFLAPRKCFLAPIPELDEAAELLDRAADCLLAANVERARELIKQADMPAVRAYALSVMGRVSTDIHRHRVVDGIPPLVARSDRARVRRLGPFEEMTVFARDGYRCRYCSSRVLVSKARNVMMSAVPDVLHWGNADKDKHAAFYALTAVADHFVPHARGGTSAPENLITTYQSCNYGKDDSLIEQLGLIDPWTRPPICDNWDGLSRLLQNTLGKRTMDRYLAVGTAPESNPRRGQIEKADPMEKLSQEDWFAQLDGSQPQSSKYLITFLADCVDFDVTWVLEKELIIRMRVGSARLAILGIHQNGDIEVPWDITGYKEQYRHFAFALESAIPGARAYETKKWWRVKKDGRNLTLSELLAVAPAMKAAIVNLHAALKQ